MSSECQGKWSWLLFVHPPLLPQNIWAWSQSREPFGKKKSRIPWRESNLSPFHPQSVLRSATRMLTSICRTDPVLNTSVTLIFLWTKCQVHLCGTRPSPRGAKVNVNYYGSKLTFKFRGCINYGKASWRCISINCPIITILWLRALSHNWEHNSLIVTVTRLEHGCL